MATTAYTQLEKAQEENRQRLIDISQEIDENRAQKKKLLAEFDLAVVENQDTSEIEERLWKLDKEFEMLNRKALVLDNIDGSPPMVKLADGVHADVRREMDKVQDKYNGLLSELNKKREEYLAVVAKMGTQFKQSLRLQDEIKTANDVYPKGTTLKVVTGLEPDINLLRLMGPIFINDAEIKKVFETGMRSYREPVTNESRKEKENA